MSKRFGVVVALALALLVFAGPAAAEENWKLSAEVLEEFQEFLASDESVDRDYEPLAVWNPAPAQTGEKKDAPPSGGGGQKVNTGNDPRDFSTKFMPFYRYMELENGMTIQNFALFGMYALTSKFAITYELPIATEFDITDTSACAGLPTTPCLAVPGGGNPYLPNGLPAEGDGSETGMGDGIIRMFWSNNVSVGKGAFLPGVQFTLPTANNDVLGSETFAAGPIFTFVWDIPAYPAPGAFFAMMNIFEVDIFKEAGRDDIGHYVGRWFLQLPINKKHKLYILTEFQPVFDWENDDHFSFWFGPEFGKAFAPNKGVFRNGGAIYFKPGLGVSPDADFGDRKWTFEVGIRAFFPAPREKWKMMQQGR